MIPRPISETPQHIGTGKLQEKVAIITGGDSGIGRAVAYLFAKEGADITIVYLNEHGDAMETKEHILQLGRRCVTIAGDIGKEAFCREAVELTLSEFGRIDILINNAGELHYQENLERITEEQLERTFRTNVFSYFYLAKAVVPHLRPGSAIINTSSLAATLIERGIRVNAVAPGRTWTPLIPASIPPEVYTSYGETTPMKRTAQPVEIAPVYLYLASGDSTYTVGQTIHVNGGEYYGL